MQRPRAVAVTPSIALSVTFAYESHRWGWDDGPGWQPANFTSR
ncbi:hypothetical protein J2X18_002766 [Acidovorax delafieldii]|nr:hypothetical protein [Acidovorax delafieldii]